MKIIQLNPDVGRQRPIIDPQSSINQIQAAQKNIVEGEGIQGEDAEYEIFEITMQILTVAKLVFPNGEWRSWRIGCQHHHIFGAVEKIIGEASRHIPICDWVEEENMGGQMNRLLIYPHGIDIYDEDPLDKLREPERLFAHLYLENVGAGDMDLTKPEKVIVAYPDLDPRVLTTPDLWERIKASGLIDGCEHLHICAQIGMMDTDTPLLDYSETEFFEGGYEHPEWSEYPFWVSEAERAAELQSRSNMVADWVEADPENMRLVIEAINAAVHLSVGSLHAAREQWALEGLEGST